MYNANGQTVVKVRYDFIIFVNEFRGYVVAVYDESAR